ncbi:type VI secretion system baseplate subunit TssE [Paraliomyxa miuraensis]|uniref:type VI secretion system baseplate subunit TssE n=1 Tax=Paraliomyxa miuraensis TaxID=376150 RepID=UPI00224F114B|nr:type VI secretion system baseplate subunit TssE [Paraliomyxa miuraensis]MCX4243016.1 type VI secretion system baseplate subunit TssE [Paraliomyxa miuraensis]
MAARGLLSRLASADPSRPVDEVHSIVGNLRALLNTRLGDSMAAQGFGVVDFVDLVHQFPSAAQVIQRSIRNTVAEFEPRLRNVRVRLVDSGDPLSLAFEVSARMVGDKRKGLVRVRTEMSQGGRVKVE